MYLGLLSRAKIAAYCSTKFANIENDVCSVLHKKAHVDKKHKLLLFNSTY